MSQFNLTAARLNAGLSIPELAKALDIGEGPIRRLEAGLTVHPGTAKKIATKFDVQVIDLMPVPEADAA